MFCSSKYQPTTRLNQQNEKSTSNITSFSKLISYNINYNSLSLTIVKEMYETKDHSFHEIHGLMSRHLTNLMSDENILRGESPIEQQRAKIKAHVDAHQITEKISAPVDYKSKNVFDNYVQLLFSSLGLNIQQSHTGYIHLEYEIIMQGKVGENSL